MKISKLKTKDIYELQASKHFVLVFSTFFLLTISISFGFAADSIGVTGIGVLHYNIFKLIFIVWKGRYGMITLEQFTM